jgi:hypothetical protein
MMLFSLRWCLADEESFGAADPRYISSLLLHFSRRRY